MLELDCTPQPKRLLQEAVNRFEIWDLRFEIEEIEEIEESDLTDKPGGLAMRIPSFFLASRMHQSIWDLRFEIW